MQRQTRTVETLPCKLTDDELIEKGKKMAHFHSEVGRLEAEAKKYKKHYDGLIADAEKEIHEIGGQLTTGEEFRQIECSITYDFDDRKVKVTVRNDTGEIVRECPISEADLQEELALREEIAQEVERKVREGENANTEEDAHIPAPEGPGEEE